MAAPRPGQGLVQLDVLVTDAAGKPVSGLTAHDFQLLDNRQSRSIVSFHAFDEQAKKPDDPVQLMLLIDTVNPGFVDLGFIRQGLEKFLRQNGGKLPYPTSLIVFTANGVQVLSRTSTDGNALAQIVSQLKPSVRPAGVLSFPLSVMALYRIAQDQVGKPGRKILVWLGSGWPTSIQNQVANVISTPAEERDRKHRFDDIVLLSTTLRDAHIALYGGYADSAYYDQQFLKGVKKPNEEDPRDLSLSVLALQSGGRGALAYINRDSDLVDQLNSFVPEAGTYYTLSFDPSPTEKVDEYHDLKVVVKGAGLTARTNTGYYDQPDYRRTLSIAAESQAAPPSAPPIPPFAFKMVTVQELGQAVTEVQRKPDIDAAKQLSGLQLMERLDGAKLAAWKATLPGAKARDALVALADASTFLEPPPADIPTTAAPDLAAQRRMISLTVDYLAQTIPKLPNFSAVRTTLGYEDTPVKANEKETALTLTLAQTNQFHSPAKGNNKETSLTGGQPWHVSGKSAVTVVYRDGKESISATTNNGKVAKVKDPGLITMGTFGPVLSTVIVDAAHSQMTFSHWEQGSNGVQAVFRYSVPDKESHYSVAFQSLKGDVDGDAQQERTAYHGEVGIDPATGAILRIAIVADFQPLGPILRGDLMVEYGAVDIGGKSYVCPTRSVSISTGQSARMISKGRETPGVFAPVRTLLNDVTFTDYHVFRSDARILTGDERQ
jgi:VWFA-related protein